MSIELLSLIRRQLGLAALVVQSQQPIDAPLLVELDVLADRVLVEQEGFGHVSQCPASPQKHNGLDPIGQSLIPAAAMADSQILNLLDSQVKTTHHYRCRLSPHKNMNLEPKTHSGRV